MVQYIITHTIVSRKKHPLHPPFITLITYLPHSVLYKSVDGEDNVGTHTKHFPTGIFESVTVNVS